MIATVDDYKVKLQVFEGPLDLLLHLVKINEMEIQDIRITEITQQYLEYIRLMQTLDLEVAGEFLVMAATLLNIKLRSLLPNTVEEEEDDEEIADIMTARQLMEQLIEYRKFKDAAARLREGEETHAQRFFREVALPQFANVDDEALRLDLDLMLKAFNRVIRFVEARGWHQVTEEEYSVEEKIGLIHDKLQSEPRIELNDLFQACKSKVEMIVTLLALLELCRQRSLTLNQSGSYGDVYIYKRDPLAESTPKEQVSAVAPEDELPDRPTGPILEEDDEDEEDDFGLLDGPEMSEQD